MDVLYHRNDNLLELLGLRNEITEEFVDDATVTAVVKDRQGTEIGGQSWPLAMTYVTASEGNYLGVIDAALDVEPSDRVIAEITIAVTGGLEAFFKLPLIVKERT